MRSAECGVPSAECRVRSAECGAPSAERRVRSAECGVPSAELETLPFSASVEKRSEPVHGRGGAFARTR